MKRLEYVDVAKGICMLLVMLGHSSGGTGLRENSLFIRWIYSFHVMGFFIMTGFVMEHIREYDRDFRKALLSNFKGIMIPYYVFQLCYIMLSSVKTQEQIDWTHILHLLHDFYPYASWFLITLFFAKIAFIAIKKVNIIPDIIIALLFCAGIVMPSIEPYLPSPFGYIYGLSARIALAAGFMLMGCVLYKFKRYFQDYRVLIVSLIISIALGYFNGYTSAYAAVYGNPTLYAFSALSGTVFVLCLSTHINSKFLNFYGKNSLIPMGMHELILMFLKPNILNWFLLVPSVAAVTYLYVLIRKRIGKNYCCKRAFSLQKGKS